MLQEMVSGLLQDRTLVLPLYHKYKQMLTDKQNEEAAGGDAFTKVSTWGRVDEEFIATFLVSTSDLTTKDIMLAKRHDEDALRQMMEFHTGLPPALKLLDSLKNRSIALRFLRNMSALQEHPLNKFKHDAGLLATGALDWSKGAYRVELDKAGCIASVTFRNGDTRDISAEKIMVSDYVLSMNWSPWRASLEKKPFPPLRLHVFFAQCKSGPYKFPKAYTMSSPEYLEAVEKASGEYKMDKAKVQVAPAGDELGQELKRVIATKRKVAVEQARVKASEKLQEKKQRQTLTLKVTM